MTYQQRGSYNKKVRNYRDERYFGDTILIIDKIRINS